MEFSERTSVKDDLRKYDHLANKDSIIQVTQWTNGEGWDISIDDEPVISLTWGQLAPNFSMCVIIYENQLQLLNNHLLQY